MKWVVKGYLLAGRDWKIHYNFGFRWCVFAMSTITRVESLLPKLKKSGVSHISYIYIYCKRIMIGQIFLPAKAHEWDNKRGQSSSCVLWAWRLGPPLAKIWKTNVPNAFLWRVLSVILSQIRIWINFANEKFEIIWILSFWLFFLKIFLI